MAKHKGPPLRERGEFQKIKIKNPSKLYSLRQAAEIAGLCYKTAWSYTQSEDPWIKKRIDRCARYPDQTGRAYTLYSQEIVKVLQEIKKRNIKNRGPRGQTWTLTEKQKMGHKKRADKRWKKKEEK